MQRGAMWDRQRAGTAFRLPSHCLRRLRAAPPVPIVLRRWETCQGQGNNWRQTKSLGNVKCLFSIIAG